MDITNQPCYTWLFPGEQETDSEVMFKVLAQFSVGDKDNKGGSGSTISLSCRGLSTGWHLAMYLALANGMLAN